MLHYQYAYIREVNMSDNILESIEECERTIYTFSHHLDVLKGPDSESKKVSKRMITEISRYLAEIAAEIDKVCETLKH